MKRLEIKSGDVYGRLTVLQELSSYRDRTTQRKRRQFLCQCECGIQKVITLDALRTGNTQSCGCLKVEVNRQTWTTHGHCPQANVSPTYLSWAAMIQRCFTEHNTAYHNYGGRGITVCDRWKDSFSNFLEDMGEKPENLMLDRINNDGNYEPTNCEWRTKEQQARNKRNNKLNKDIVIKLRERTITIREVMRQTQCVLGTAYKARAGKTWKNI